MNTDNQGLKSCSGCGTCQYHTWEKNEPKFFVTNDNKSFYCDVCFTKSRNLTFVQCHNCKKGINASLIFINNKTKQIVCLNCIDDNYHIVK